MSFIRTLCVIGLLLSTTAWANVGKVALLKGEAVAMRNAQTITLQNGSIIEEKDAIKTGKEAQIQLLFEDKTVITLGSESEFAIAEYLNDATNPKAKFQFNQGTFKTITGNIGKIAPANFSLETKTSTIGIRGTIIKGNVGDDGDVIACLRGRIVVVSRDTGKMVEVPAGQFTIVKPSESPSAPKETTPGTTDDSLVQNSSSAETPQVVENIIENSQDSAKQNLVDSTNAVGDLTLYGLATSGESVGLPLEVTINRATAQVTGSIGESVTILSSPDGTVSSSINEHYNVPAVLYVDPSGNEFSYLLDDLFFGNVNSELMIVTSNYIENNERSEYVQWGIWEIGSIDNYYPSREYWVAGKIITPESTIASLMTQAGTYTYNGKVLGKVQDISYNGYSSDIDTQTSDVMLKFNFNTTSTIDASSYIRFSALGETWDIKPTQSVVSSTGFSASALQGLNSGNVQITSGSINGKFFGTNAEAVGGAFNASSPTQVATGVFKAVR